MVPTVRTALAWLYGAPVRPRSPLGLWLPTAVAVVALAVGWRVTTKVARPLLASKPQPVLSGDDVNGVRFGVPEATRRQVFADFAKAEPQSRANGVSSFPGPELAWSAEDHRGAYERKTAAELMGRYGLTMSQVYLILDEGIRGRWPGPDGQPLDPHTVPLNPRRKY